MRGDETIYSFPGDWKGRPFHLQMTGISRCDGSYRIARLPSPDFFVFEQVLRGRGFLEIGGRLYEPKAGDVYFVDGRLKHAYWSDAKEPWEKIWFNVEGPLVSRLVDLYGLQGRHLFENCPLEPLFRRGFDAARENPASAEDVVCLCVHELLIELSKRLASGETPRELVPEAIAKVRAKIDSDLSKTHSLESLCSVSGLGPSQTLRLFKKAFSCTPVRYSLDRRIAAAKLLLEGTAKSVKEIAGELGFADEYYFSNMFKARAGVSPRAWRVRSRQGGAANPVSGSKSAR